MTLTSTGSRLMSINKFEDSRSQDIIWIIKSTEVRLATRILGELTHIRDVIA